MPVPDQVRDDESGIQKRKTLKLDWIPGHADCKKLSIYSQLQARNDKTAIYLDLPMTTLLLKGEGLSWPTDDFLRFFHFIGL